MRTLLLESVQEIIELQEEAEEDKFLVSCNEGIEYYDVIDKNISD